MSSSPVENSEINNENDNFQNINSPLRENEEDNNFNIEKENGEIQDNVQDNFPNTNKEISQPVFPPKSLNDDYPYYFKYSNSTKGDVFHKSRKFFPSYNKEYQINQLNNIINKKNDDGNIPNIYMIEDTNYNNNLNYKTPINRENNYHYYMNYKTPNDLEYNYLKNLDNKELANKENIYYNKNNLNDANIINPIKIENGCFNKDLNNNTIINRENNYKNINIEVKENKNLNYNYLCDNFTLSNTLNNRKNKSNYEEINNNFITADKINIDTNSEDRFPKDIIENNKEYLINHEIKNIAFMFKKINIQNASPEPCLIKNKYADLF